MEQWSSGMELGVRRQERPPTQHILICYVQVSVEIETIILLLFISMLEEDKNNDTNK